MKITADAAKRHNNDNTEGSKCCITKLESKNKRCGYCILKNRQPSITF